MAAVPVMIIGTITGKATKEGDVSATEQVVIHGLASIEGLGVGGGPMPGGGGPPLGFWGGRPPEYVDIGGPAPQPPMPTEPPVEGTKPPPPGGGWGYSPEYGWGYFPKPSEPGPKK
jgi:U5 snRNP spliceosome subunit